MNNAEVLKPLIYNICDSLEFDISVKGHRMKGSALREQELFEGYSPTVSTSITDSLLDYYGVVAACVRIWGNLAVLIVNDKKADRLTLFVYDKAKVKKDSRPWIDYWSRKEAYKFLGPCCKAIYYRSVFEIVWQELDQGPQKLTLYNEMRDADEGARDSYLAMWGDL